MIKKKLIAFAVFPLFVISCSSGVTEASSSSVREPSMSSSEIEEADPNGFDPNFDYVGTNAYDFEIMASRYIANPQLVFEPKNREYDYYYKTAYNSDIITFPFRNSNIIARRNGGKIKELYRIKSGKMTISEARRLGYIGETQAKQSEAYVHYFDKVKASSTKRYEIDQSFGHINHKDLQGRPEGITKYIDFFSKYGIPTSMFVYYDGFADNYMHNVVGNGWMGLTVDYASAIPIYSDNLVDIVGVMTIGKQGTGISKVFSYLEEDGFGKVKKAKEIITQVQSSKVEKVINPCFFVKDTTLIPKGDWRIVLGDSTTLVE